MPKKIRELKKLVRKAGFELLPDRGKGSHTVWRHPLLTEDITIPGKDSSDAKPYLEQQVMRALKLLESMEKDSDA